MECFLEKIIKFRKVPEKGEKQRRHQAALQNQAVRSCPRMYRLRGLYSRAATTRAMRVLGSM